MRVVFCEILVDLLIFGRFCVIV